MNIHVITDTRDGRVLPKAFVNKQLAEQYVGDQTQFEIHTIYLDVTVDIKRNMSQEDLEAAMKMAI